VRSASADRWATDSRSTLDGTGSAFIASRPGRAAAQGGLEIVVEGGEIRLKKPASGDHDHIDSESCPCLGAPAENLSHQAFRAIPGYRVSNFPARH